MEEKKYIETVGDLIMELMKYPFDMQVRDMGKNKIERIYQDVWTDTNYPYDQPDADIVVIE